MASTTMVHIRVDEKLKREACAALDGMGLSLSDAVEDVNVGTLESFESVTSLMASIDENN